MALVWNMNRRHCSHHDRTVGMPKVFSAQEQMEALKAMDHRGWKSRVLDATYAVSEGADGLERALSRLANQHGKWLQLGGVATAKLPAGDKMHVSLLYIDKGTEIPNHTHLGLEMTLVLSGTICDENGEYGAGDLLINTPADTHTPHTRADQDCLCLSVLSAPLKFNKGLTRLLNPLQQFFY